MRVGWILAFAVLVAAGPARADDAAPPTVSHWYGGRLLLADGASLAVLAAGGTQKSAPIVVLGLAGLVVASPVLHTVHAGLGKGLSSLALRVTLPALGLFIGKGAADGCWRQLDASDTCDISAMIVGMLVGGIAAELVDVIWLARDAHPGDPVAPPPAPVVPPSVQLLLAPQRGGAVTGLAGRF